MIPSPKPVLNLDKKVEEDTPKTSSKKKRTPAKDEVEEDAPKTSSKRKRTPVEEKVEEETPNTSSKKKRTPAKEKVSIISPLKFPHGFFGLQLFIAGKVPMYAIKKVNVVM